MPKRTTVSHENVGDFEAPDKYNVNHDCKDRKGCAKENNYFSITSWEDNLCLNYYHKIKDLTIAPISARFSINYCPMCGKKISDTTNDELEFW